MAKKAAQPKATTPKATPKPRTTSQKSGVAGGAAKRQYLVPSAMVYHQVGDNPITVELAKKWLGWTVAKPEDKWGDDYLLRDLSGNKVRCTNNMRNRPLTMSSVAALMQEMLKGRWRLNGETIILGTDGTLLNGQHTLCALVLAEEERTIGKRADHWQQYQPHPMTIEKVVVTGIATDDSTVNTMDVCKPRSLAEVIYRSEYFANVKPSQRKAISRATDYAVRLLWKRTGAFMDAFAPRRTHAESLDFIQRHPSLLKAVQHVVEEDDKGSISKFLTVGYSSAMLYLMATSATADDSCLQYQQQTPTEATLSLELWDKACEFWVVFGAGGDSLRPLKYALGALYNDDTATASIGAKLALFAKAWNVWSLGDDLTDDALELHYVTDDDGLRTLAECPVVGGIDIGGDNLPATTEEDDDTALPTPEQIEQRKAEARAARENGNPVKAPKPRRAGAKQ